MRLYKLTDWESRLADYVRLNIRRDFDRHLLDCVRYTDGALEAMTGHRLMSTEIPDYQNEDEARSYIKSLGDDGFFKEVDRICLEAGFKAVDWKWAQRGAVVFYTSMFDAWAGGLGICNGAQAVTITQGGTRAVNMRLARGVWNIPT